jgi:hypothetical protein
LLPAWFAAGIGNHPHPVPPVIGPDLPSAHSCPFAHIPVFGQLSAYSLKPSSVSNEACHVLHECDSRLYLAKHPPEIRPKITLVGLPLLLAGAGVGLAVVDDTTVSDVGLVLSHREIVDRSGSGRHDPSHQLPPSVSLNEGRPVASRDADDVEVPLVDFAPLNDCSLGHGTASDGSDHSSGLLGK